MDRTRLDAAIQCIRDYTDRHSKLKAAHHFVFDSPLDKCAGVPRFVMMGINPGETDSDRKDGLRAVERTWLRDFYDGKSEPPSKRNMRWRKLAKWFANDEPLVLTELFFWNSHDGEALEEMIGPLWASGHLDFCKRMNRILIEVYRPKAVIFTGTGIAERVADKYCLHHVRDIREDYVRKSGMRKGERVNIQIMKHYRDALCPWFFIRHPMAAFGVSKREQEDTRNYIHANL
jgi:hypothetical protein